MKNGQFPISLIWDTRHAFRIFGDWNSIIPKLANCQYIISQHNPFSSLRQFNWLLTLGIHGATQGHGKIEDMSTILLFFSFPRRPRTVGWYGIFWYMTNANEAKFSILNILAWKLKSIDFNFCAEKVVPISIFAPKMTIFSAS